MPVRVRGGAHVPMTRIFGVGEKIESEIHHVDLTKESVVATIVHHALIIANDDKTQEALIVPILRIDRGIVAAKVDWNVSLSLASMKQRKKD